jgi:hypothetical protein
MYRLPLVLLLPLAVGLAGCSAGSNREPVFPVQGEVLFQGQPATGAQVVFHPVGNNSLTAVRPSGQVDSTGKFTLTTHAAGDGAPAGDYAVTVELWLSKNDNPAVNQLPRRYQHASTSGLRATVTAGENQLPALKLAR